MRSTILFVAWVSIGAVACSGGGPAGETAEPTGKRRAAADSSQPQPRADSEVQVSFAPIGADLVPPTAIERRECSISGRKVCFSLLGADLMITEDGHVEDAQITRAVAWEEGHMLGEEETQSLAIQQCVPCLKAWRFRPATKAGVPVRVRFPVFVSGRCQ